MCVEMDISKEHRHYFWIGPPNKTGSHFQEVIFETLPACCSTCRQQGHSNSACRREKLHAGNQKRALPQARGDFKSIERQNRVWKLVNKKDQMQS